MSRIRSVKPDFFRHEGLQDLEIANPGMYPMMVFEGLWGHCDKAGRFEWKPRTLKLDILPFIPFDMAQTLAILEAAGYVKRYVVDGKEYGLIESFEKHQRINGKEAQEPEKYPEPNKNKQGSNREAIEKQSRRQEGKGREEEGNGIDLSGLVVSELTPCPHLEIISLYSEILPSLPQVRKWEGNRAKQLKSRWSWVLHDLKAKGKPCDMAAGLDFFRRMFAYIGRSDFLMGRSGSFSCSLPWIVKDENFTKIIEGNYENKEVAA